MKLKILAISDTHLGEETSLLSFPHGLHHLWKTLREKFGGGESFDVEELILIGDITDRTLSSTSQIIFNTNAFSRMLGGAAEIKKAVFIPGNHEHTLWTKYHQLRDGNENFFSITENPDGELLINKGERKDTNKSAEELFIIFFGYPVCRSWREMGKLDFSIANPVYVKQINDRTYVFTHGAHFCSIVSKRKITKQLFDYSRLDKWLGKIEIKSDCDVREADSLESLEKIVSRFMDSLWPSSKNNPTSRSDQLWYLYTTLRGKFKSRKNPRSSPPSSSLFKWSDLKKVNKDRIKRLTDTDGKAEDKSIERWQKHFCGHMLKYLKEKNIPTDNIVFVYGDTHDGGWGEKQLDSGENIRIYNTGGWVVDNPKVRPACHLFAVDENCEEYLLDVSFDNVKVGNDSLLELAAIDYENHNNNTSRIMRFLTKLVFGS